MYHILSPYPATGRRLGCSYIFAIMNCCCEIRGRVLMWALVSVSLGWVPGTEWLGAWWPAGGLWRKCPLVCPRDAAATFPPGGSEGGERPVRVFWWNWQTLRGDSPGPELWGPPWELPVSQSGRSRAAPRCPETGVSLSAPTLAVAGVRDLSLPLHPAQLPGGVRWLLLCVYPTDQHGREQNFSSLDGDGARKGAFTENR